MCNMRLGWARFSAWSREVVFVASCILGKRKSNRMYQKPDNISNGSGVGTKTYLQVLLGKDLGKVFPGDGVSPDPPPT